MNNTLKKILFTTLLFFTFLHFGNCQSIQIDSLALLLKNNKNQIAIQNELADLLMEINPQKAISYANKALTLSIKSNNKKEKSKAIRILLHTYINIKDIKHIKKVQKDATTFYKNQTEYEKGNIHFSKALLNYKSASYTKASVDFFNALRFFEKSNANIERCKTLRYIGLTYYYQNSIKKGFEYYSKALECSISGNFQNEIAKGYNNVAIIHVSQKKYENAENFFNKALKINKNNNNIVGKSRNYANLGMFESTKKNYRKGLEYLKKTIQLTKNKNPKIEAAMYTAIAINFRSQNKLDSAIYYGKKSLEIPELQLDVAISTTQLLRNIYIGQKDTSTAYLYEIKNKILTDSLRNINNLMKLNFAELQYTSSKKEDQLKFENQKTKFTYIILSLILLLLLGLIFYFINLRLKIRLSKTEDDKRNIEQTLQFKNKELTSKAMYLIQKNQTMSKISDELNKLSKDLNSNENKVKAKKIATKLQKNTNEEVWKEFELYFNSVNPNFNTNLLKDFTHLTPNEKKLAAFLSMNMNSKEISAITGQRIATLEVARSRLRKKLNISNQNISLPSFFEKFK